MDRALFEARGGRVEEIRCPGGAVLWLRTLTTKEFLRYQSRLSVHEQAQDDGGESRDDEAAGARFAQQMASYVEILTYSLCDPDTLEPLGKDAVDELPYPLLVRLAEKAFELQAMPEQFVESQKKDSGPTLATVSSSR